MSTGRARCWHMVYHHHRDHADENGAGAGRVGVLEDSVQHARRPGAAGDAQHALLYCYGNHDLQQRAICVLEGTGAVDSRNIDLGNGESVLQAVFTVSHRAMSSVVP